MSKNSNLLHQIIVRLEKFYGRPSPPKVVRPLDMILLENVAYLVSDEQREKAFDALKARVGTTAENILSASPSTLLDVTKLGGIHGQLRAQRLLLIAQIVLEEV